MKKFLKNCLFSLIVFVILLGLLELTYRLFSTHGTYRFIERRLIEQNVKLKKNKNEYRIMMYGESTMFGGELYPKSTIPLWTDIYLKQTLDRESAKNINVINLGRLGEDSVFISKAFADTVDYKPDLVVFFTAHNDFIQLQHRQNNLKKPSGYEKINSFLKWLGTQSYFFSEITRYSIHSKQFHHRNDPAPEPMHTRWYDENLRVTNLSNNPDNYLIPHSEEINQLAALWKSNVMRIIKTAQKNNIPVIFIGPISRWEDYPPFKSVHKNDLSEESIQNFNNIFETAELNFKNQNYETALNEYEDLLKIDNQYALIHYRIGQIYRELNMPGEANKYFINSNEFDYFPIRSPQLTYDFYDELSKQKLDNVYIIRAKDLLLAAGNRQYLTDELVYDQLHPNIKGQAILGKEIVKIIHDKNLGHKTWKWDWKNIEDFKQLYKKLEIDNNFLSDFRLAIAMYSGSYIETAIKHLELAVELNPSSVHAKSMLAWCYKKIGKVEKAQELYKELLILDPVQTQKYLDSLTKGADTAED